MKKKTYLVFEILMAVTLIGLNVSFLNNYVIGTVLLKSAASLFFVLAGFCGYIKNIENRGFSKLMLYGYICCMAGDIFLALDSSGILFVFGVVSFAGAHVLYSVAFCKAAPVKKTDIPVMAVLFIGLVMLLCLGSFNFQGLFPVLIIYSAIISFMVTKALSLWNCHNNIQERHRRSYCEARIMRSMIKFLCTLLQSAGGISDGGPAPATDTNRLPTAYRGGSHPTFNISGIKLIITGSILFLISDIVLLFWLFGTGTAKEVQCVNWVLYYMAQGCLAAALNAK